MAPITLILDTPVFTRIANNLTCPVNRSIRRLASHLGASIAIQIVNHELSVMFALTNIYAEIDPPQKSPIELVGIQNGLTGNSRM